MFRSTIKKLTLLVALGLLSLPANLFSGTTGKITGIVKDKETGDALPGVNIILDGTTMGAATNASGEFSIINVPAGVYSISTSMIGYTKVTKQNVRVLPDFTTRLDFELSPESLGGEEVIIVAERPLIQKDQTMTMTVTSSEEIKNLPIRGFQSAANLGVGIVTNTYTNGGRNVDGGTGGVFVRGGRPSETGVYIDGFQQNNLLTGVSNASIPNGSVEEVQVITGGFDAEYGRNQSGIIQVTTKAGGQRYSGSLEYVNDRAMFALNKNEYYGYDVYSGGFGGQLIPGNNRIKFYVSAEGKDITDAEPSVYGYPKYSFSNEGIRGENEADIDTVIFDTDANGNIKYKKGARPKTSSGYGVNSDRGINFQSKLSFDVIPNSLRLDLNGNLTRNYRRAFLLTYTVNPDHTQHRDLSNINIGSVATYTLNANSFADLGVNYFSNKLHVYDDNYGKNITNYDHSTTDNTGFSTYYNDNFMRFPDRPNQTYTRSEDAYIAVKANYVNQINKQNQLKFGADFFRHTVRLLNLRELSADPVHGANDNIGYTVTADKKLKKVNSDDLENKILGATHPISFSGYLQNKMEVEGLVLRAGLRYDLFNAGVKRVKDLSDPTGQANPDHVGKYTDLNGNNTFDVGVDRLWAGTIGPEDYTNSKSDNKISPRLSVSFPVSEKTQFRMSYGKFFQQPNLNALYVSPDFLERQSISPPFSASVGNPNLHAEESTQYEVGIRRLLTDRISIDVNAYYKDIKNLVNVRITQSQPNGLVLYNNYDEGVVQGVNIAFEMRRTSKIQGRLAYTLQSARGSGSGQATGFQAAWLGFQTTKLNAPLNFDQRHTFNANLDIRNGKDEGPMIGGNHILDNAGVNFQFNAASGIPYTPVNINSFGINGVPAGKPVGRRNSQNQPWTVRLDLKADKTVFISNTMNVNVYLQVLNLLDHKNVALVWPATGDADDDGYLGTAAGRSLNERQVQQYYLISHDGLVYDTPRQARIGILFNF
ncbi:TonB-dependent receptor [bacterium]|nr:TonB-dependent receptor [bacterium]